MNNMNLPRETINPYEQGGKFYPSPEPPSKEAQEAMRKILSTPAGQLGSLGGGSYTRKGYRTWDERIIPLTKEQEINLEQKLKPKMGGGMMASKNPYGFTRDPNSVGLQVIVEWYNPSTGETWTAPDSSWRPPNDQWVSQNFPNFGGRPNQESVYLPEKTPFSEQQNPPISSYGDQSTMRNNIRVGGLIALPLDEPKVDIDPRPWGKDENFHRWLKNFASPERLAKTRPDLFDVVNNRLVLNQERLRSDQRLYRQYQRDEEYSRQQKQKRQQEQKQALINQLYGV